MGSERHAECGSPSAPPLLPSLPEQRWHLPVPLEGLRSAGPNDHADQGGLESFALPDELLAVLRRRGSSMPRRSRPCWTRPRPRTLSFISPI